MENYLKNDKIKTMDRNIETYKYYLQDFVKIIIENIDNIIKENKDDYSKGQLMVYYEIVTLLKEQATAFGIDFKELGLNNIDENNIIK